MTNNTEESPFREWWQHTFGKWLNVFIYWKTRRAILADPTITLSARSNELNTGPFQFALQSIFLVPLLTTFLSGSLMFFSEIPPDPIEKIIEQVDETSEWPPDYEPLFGIETGKSRYESTKVYKRGIDIMKSSVPALVSFAIIMVGFLFRRFFISWQDTYPLVKQSDRVYLYCVGARLFIPVNLFGLLLYVEEMVTRYALLTVTDAHGYTIYGSQSWFVTRYAVGLFFVGWIILALWNSTADIACSLQLKGERNGRRVRGRRAVAIRLFSAQLIALIVADLLYVSILIIVILLNT
jgi:hypothetical protein